MERKRDVRHVDMELMHYRLGWLATIGLALMAVGMAALYAPYYSSFSLQNLIGSFFLIGGGMLVVDAFWSRQEGRFVPEFLLGLLYLIFAFFIVYKQSDFLINRSFLKDITDSKVRLHKGKNDRRTGEVPIYD